MSRLRAALLLVLALGPWACTVPAADARVHELLPDSASFPLVAQLLDHHCGTLDCHGQVGRNLRLYGNEGLRWAPSDRPLSPACTTAGEIDQDYESVVALEPAAMSAVIAGGGARPERLSLIRKARGLEHHKGGTLIHAGDDADVCLTSWLRSQLDSAACMRAQLPSTCFAQP